MSQILNFISTSSKRIFVAKKTSLTIGSYENTGLDVLVEFVELKFRRQESMSPKVSLVMASLGIDLVSLPCI